MNILQSKSEAFGVENINFIVKTRDRNVHEEFNFASSLSKNSGSIRIEVCIPNYIFILFAQGRANWDHIAIGYLGEWHRDPDIYPANFMRLLQSGQSKFQCNSDEVAIIDIQEILNFTIADLVEKEPNVIPYYLTRLGLPCLICIRSNSETLSQALNIHNVDIESNAWLLRELSSLVVRKN
jgi:CMP-N-acetylneuraminate monooxygenase